MPIQKRINKDFFKKWNRDMSYILGFMYADGNIIKNKRGAHFFAIYSADRELINQMRVKMESNHKISNRKSISGFNYCIQIGSGEMFQDLVRIGMRPNKTLRMNLPEIPDKFFPDFLRGYFDGDGNVWVGENHKNRQKRSIAIQVCFTSCSEEFLESILNRVRALGVCGGYITGVKNKKCFRLCFSINDALKLFGIMYNKPHDLFLQRKRLVFERFIEKRHKQ